MIHYLATAGFRVTVRNFLDDEAGIPWRERIQVHAYEAMRHDDDGLPGGTWVFSDVDRLSSGATIRAARLAMVLAERSDVRIVNHPVRSMRRYELIRWLRETGVNPYDAVSLTESRWPSRYPVFLRRDDGHEGPLTPLLADRSMLERAMAQAMASRYQRDTILAVEFCDTRDADGIYRKYSVWRFGEVYFPAHVLFGRDWALKHTHDATPESVAEEMAFLDADPHREAVRAVFEAARIEFGRIDYSVKDGRIVVWEINTNPNWWPAALALPLRAPVRARMVAGFEAGLSSFL